MSGTQRRAARTGPPRSTGATRTSVETLDRSYPAEPGSVPLARHEIADLARRHDATGRQVDDIRLAVSEAVANAITHGYRLAGGTVHAVAAIAARRMTLLIADDGVGPTAPAERPGSGWGWPVIAAVTERFTIRRRRSGGTEVEMQFRIGPDGQERG
jgi:anti-sigma regulatory factor (Ser/Thr protein kinase)